jgi:hypothetical protein
MKTVTHLLYPISYLDNSGEQVDTVYTWNPGRTVSSQGWFIGEPITVSMQHKELGPEAMAAKIAALEAELAELRSAAA